LKSLKTNSEFKVLRIEIFIRILIEIQIMINDLKNMTSRIRLIFIEEIKINILYHLNKKKVNGANPEILIIINRKISFNGINLIHEEKFEEE